MGSPGCVTWVGSRPFVFIRFTDEWLSGLWALNVPRVVCDWGYGRDGDQEKECARFFWTHALCERFAFVALSFRRRGSYKRGALRKGLWVQRKDATLCFLSFLFVAWLLCILGVLSEQDSLSLLLSMSIQAEWPRLLEGLALHGGVSAGCGDGEAAERTRQYNSPWSLEDLSGPRGPECTIMTVFYPVCHCKVWIWNAPTDLVFEYLTFGWWHCFGMFWKLRSGTKLGKLGH